MGLSPVDIVRLYDRTIADGGVTINVRSGVIIDPAHFRGTDAYVVADPTASALVPTFNVGRFGDAVRTVEQGSDLIGTWVDGPNIWVDRVDIIYGRENALRVGYVNGQKAIYNLDTQTVEEL